MKLNLNLFGLIKRPSFTRKCAFVHSVYSEITLSDSVNRSLKAFSLLKATGLCSPGWYPGWPGGSGGFSGFGPWNGGGPWGNGPWGGGGSGRGHRHGHGGRWNSDEGGFGGRHGGGGGGRGGGRGGWDNDRDGWDRDGSGRGMLFLFLTDCAYSSAAFVFA